MKLFWGIHLLLWAAEVCVGTSSVDDRNSSGSSLAGTVPNFFLASWVSQCKLDSPEILFERRTLPSLNAFLQEGRILFGTLMKNLESSLAGVQRYEDLGKEWIFLMNVINESLELAVNRIDNAWYDLIDTSDTVKLPWELKLALPVILEQFHAIIEEYKLLEAVFKAGAREMIKTLSHYIVEVFEKLEDHMFYHEDSGRAQKGMTLQQRLEISIDKLEPNFVGNLLKTIVRGGTEIGDLFLNGKTQVNFFSEPQREIVMAMDFFQSHGNLDSGFWAGLTSLLLYGDHSSVVPSEKELLELYSTNEKFLIDLVVTLLAADLH